MNYQNIIKEVFEALETYKSLVKDENVGELYKVKSVLVANRAILRQLYISASGYYLDAKATHTKAKCESYKAYRDSSISTLDATNYSKLDNIDKLKAMNEFKKQRDEAKSLYEDTGDVLIEIATILKQFKQEIKYEH